MDLSKTLKGIDLFDELGKAELKQLAGICKVAEFPAGTVIFNEDDPGSSMCVVAEGAVRLIKQISPAVDKTMLVARAGMVFGEVSFIDRKARSARAVTEVESTVIAIERDDFDKLAGDAPAFARVYLELSETMADRLRLSNELVKETLQWGLAAAGGAALNLDKIISDSVLMKIDLADGKQVTGKILKVEQSKAGYEVTLLGEDDRLCMVPYHAIVRVYF